MDDNVSATGDFQGDTNLKGTIGYTENTSNGISTCGAYDGHSTVYFGDRQPGVLATTCWDAVAHEGRNKLVEADIEIDKTDRRWTTLGGGSDCNNEYDLQSIITHEFGHWFGLAHTCTSVALTMYKYAPAQCTTAWRTLAKGDVLGLRQLY